MNAARTSLRMMGLLGAIISLSLHAQIVTESFTGSTADGWVFDGVGYTPNLTSGVDDPVNEGWLRLTSAGTYQATSAYYDTAVSSENRTIFTSFDFASYGGTGADGLTFFLFDGSVTFDVGADGGSMGYAQKTGVDGLAGGYVAISLDDYGNFSNETEGRVGGIGFNPNAVAVRGPAANDYEFIAATGDGTNAALTQQLDFIGGTRPDQTGVNYRHAEILITPTNQLTVWLQFGIDGALTKVLEADLSDYARPDTLKFGFTSGTGGSTGIHELRGLTVATLVANLWDNDANAGGTASGDWGTAVNWNPDVPATGDDILFDNTYVSVAQTVNVGTGETRTIRSIQIDAPFSYTLNNGTLEFDDVGLPGFLGINVTQTNGVSGAAHTINSDISLLADTTIRNAGGTTLALSGDIALGGNTLSLEGTDATTVAGVISGTGDVSTSGTGSVLLSAANTYSGGTSIANIVTASNNSSLGTGAVNVSTGGNLQLQGGITIANTLTLAGTGTGAADGALENLSGANTQSGAVTLAGATRIQSTAGTLTLGGNITGSGQNLTLGGAGDTVVSGAITTGAGTVTKDGAGTLTYSGGTANTYTGVTTVNAGTVNLSKTANTVSIAGDLAITAGTVNQTASGQLAATTGLTLTGGTYNLDGTGSVTQTVQSLNTSSGTTVNLGMSDTLTVGGTASNTVAGVIAGAGNLTHAGSGTTTLSAANTYTGTTTISSGTVQLGANNVFANTSAMNIASGTLNLAGYSDKVGALTTSTGAVLDFGSAAGNNSFVFDAFTPAASSILTVNNYVGPTVGSATDGNFANAGDFLGSTTALSADVVNQIYFSGYGVGSYQNTTLRDAGNGLGNAYRIAPTIDSFTYIWTGNNNQQTNWTRTQNWSSSPPPNTANPTNVFVSFGTGSTASVNFNASATINALRFTGSTGYTISGANTLTFQNGTSLTYVQQQSAASQTLSPASLVIKNNMVFDVTGAGTLTVGAAISDGGSALGVTKTGTGGALIYSGSTANTYTGDTTVNSGTLQLSKTAGTTAVAGNLVVNGGTVTQTTSGQINSAGTVTVNSGTFNLGTGTAVTQTFNTLNTSSGSTLNLGASAALTINNASTNTLAGLVTGSGTLTKTGAGTLNLNSANTYTGATALNAGRTELGAANAFSSSASITVATGAVLDLNGYAQSITSLQGAGSVEFGGATLTLANGASSFGGDFGFSNGTIVINAGQSLTLTAAMSAANINIILNGGTLYLGNGLNHTFGNLTVNTATTSVIDFGTSGATSVEFDNVYVNGTGQLNVNNWTDYVDYFISNNTTGAQGTAPNTKIVFAGFSGSDTKWLPYGGGGQLTPVPEPSTYGATLLGVSAGLFLLRRRRRA